MNLINKVIVGFATIVLVLLTGCSAAVYKQTEANVADVTSRSTEARVKSDTDANPQAALVMNPGLYVDKTPIALSQEPHWLRNHIVIRGQDLPFAYYSRTIVGGVVSSNQDMRDFKECGGFFSGTRAQNVLTRYQVGLDPNITLSMNYSGDIRGALDLIAAKTGYVYSINGNDIYWQAFLTKTFSIAFMPGTSDYMMGKSSSSSAGPNPIGGGGGGSGSSSGGGGGSTASAMLDDSAASQYSALKGSLSIWDDLAATIKQLLSPQGTVVVSQATTSVTVRDKASNIELVSRYVENLNSNLSQQVLVKIQVLEVSLHSDYSLGINWDVVQRAFSGGSAILKANFGTPISIKPLGGVSTPQLGVAPPAAGSRETWFSSLVNALRQQGKVSVVSEPRVVCLNNQVSAIRLVKQEGYLASVQNTSLAGSSSGGGSSNIGTVTSQLTPGSLVTGVTIYLLPKILGNKVYLQVNVDLSNNLGFTQFGPNGSSGSSETAGQSNIQLPNVSQKQFNQRSVIDSGETLILSGFRQVSNEADSAQLFESQTLGGRGSIQQNAETIVLITPLILHGGAC